MNILKADSPEIVDFLERWDRADREKFERRRPGRLSYDDYEHPRKIACTRQKYIACDDGLTEFQQGKYLVERTTGKVYTIKVYSVPHHYLGLVHELFPEEAK